jgi:hypothetical protein
MPLRGLLDLAPGIFVHIAREYSRRSSVAAMNFPLITVEEQNIHVGTMMPRSRKLGLLN